MVPTPPVAEVPGSGTGRRLALIEGRGVCGGDLWPYTGDPSGACNWHTD